MNDNMVIPVPFQMVDLKEMSDLQPGDIFLWRSISGEYSIHAYHSDAGYGIKTFTGYDFDDDSSFIVSHSGFCGIIMVKNSDDEKE